MEELKIETKNGNIPIDKELVKKYNLKKGTKSPFTCNRIVGENGEYIHDEPKEKYHRDLDKKQEEGISETEYGMMMKTSEIIDFSEGVDSSLD